MPGCESCSAASSDSQPMGRFCEDSTEEHLTAKGKTITPEMAAVIGTVDQRLRAMLEGHAGSKAYLQHGDAYEDLPSTHDHQPRATRHDRVVAHVCNVGVRAVQSCRLRLAKAREVGEVLPCVRPRQRGRKRRREIPAPSQGQEEDMQQTDDDQEMLVAFRAPGEDAQTHHGVTGRYVQAADGNSENHAISLVLGRLYVYALVNNIPDETVAGILSLFRLAGVDIGQKHHHKAAISSFGGIVSRMCIEGVAQSFAKQPKIYIIRPAGV